jgi:hypothetical protein
MSTIEERLIAVEVRANVLEGNMTNSSRAMTAIDADLKTMIAALDARMERRFDSLDRRFMALLAVQFATLLAIIGAAVGAVTRLMP